MATVFHLLAVLHLDHAVAVVHLHFAVVHVHVHGHVADLADLGDELDGGVVVERQRHVDRVGVGGGVDVEQHDVRPAGLEDEGLAGCDLVAALLLLHRHLALVVHQDLVQFDACR